MEPEVREAKILIAEDSEADLLLIQEALSTYGVQAQMSRYPDGEAALTALIRLSTSDLPDLIILDLNLPRINGMELLRYVRNSPLFARVPVLVFTSSRSPADRVQAERLGANAYVSKPSRLDDFLSTVGSTICSLIGGSGLQAPGLRCAKRLRRKLSRRAPCFRRRPALRGLSRYA